MPYVPKPLEFNPDWPVYRQSGRQLWATARYRQDDGSYLERGRGDTSWYRETLSRVESRTRNRMRVLATGQRWSPCTDYRIVSSTVDYKSGTTSVPDQSFQLVGPPMISVLWYSGFQTEFGPYVDNWGIPLPMDLNTRNRVHTELMLKVRDGRASYGEAIAESRKTINQIARSATSVFKALLAARRGQWNQVARHLGVTNRQFFTGKSAASRWLEYQYGWLPLYEDVYDGYNLLMKGFRDKKQIASSVRSIKDVAGDRHLPSWRSYTSGSSMVNYRGKVFYSIQDSALSNLDQMGLINPLSLAWNLTPYSFAVDWFLPIGNVLDALTATFGVDFIDGFTSVRVVSNYTTAPFLNGEETTTMRTVSSLNAYRRDKLHGFPLPGLYVKSPFTTKHMLSALGLLRQLQR